MAETYPVESLHRRLATGLGNKGGARGSLTKCVGRLSGLKRALDDQGGDGGGGGDNTSTKPSPATASTAMTVAETSDAMTRELQLSRIELTKLFLMVQRQEEELEEIMESNSDNTTQSTTTTATDPGSSSSATTTKTQQQQQTFDKKMALERESVKQLRQELQRASSTVASKAEYEQTAKLLCAQHPTSTAVLKEEIQGLQTALSKAQAEYNGSKAQMKLRQSQFRLLLQCMLDLKQSLSEPLDVADQGGGGGLLAHSTAALDGEDEDEQEHGTESKERTHDTTTTADLAKGVVGGTTGLAAAMEEDDEDEEGALYDDL